MSVFTTSMDLESLIKALHRLGFELQSYEELYRRLKSTDLYYELPLASPSIPGGVKVGDGLSITNDGTLSVTVNGLIPASALPAASGEASVGTSPKFAREDHIHPAQTTITGNAATATQFESAQSVTLTGDMTGSASSKAGWEVETTLTTTGVIAGSYGPAANVSPAHSGTFSVPYITVDSKGRVTEASTKTITLPADSDTTYKVMTGASSTAAGASGLVPVPAQGDQAKVLSGAGTWVTNTGDTHWTTKLIAGASDDTANAATSNGNTTLRLFDNATARSTIAIKGTGATTVVSDANGVITISSTDTKYTAAAATPLVAGTGTVGTSAKYAREDHVHPVQTSVSGNAGTATKFASAQSVALTGDVTGSASSQAGWSITTTLANTDVTAGSYGPSANATPGYGKTFSVPYFTVDTKGRITAASTKTITLPASDNTDTHWTTKLIAGASDSTANASTTNGNTTLRLFDGSTARNTIAIKGTGATTVTSDANGVITISSTNTTYTLSSLGIGNVKNYDQSKAISSITRSGTTFTYTCLDGTTGTFTQQDNNTTYSNMTAATADAAGKAGLVPAPAAGKQTSFLRGDGTWVIPTNTTYSNFVKSGSGAKAGLVPAPSTTAGTTKYLREDGTWTAPPDTNTTYSAGTGLALSGTTFSVASTAGTSALAWNSEVTLGTVGGLAIKAKLPANPNTDTHWTSHLYVGASDGSANAATANGATYLMILDNSTVRDRRLIKGTGATTVTSDANGVITINSTDNNTTYSNFVKSGSGAKAGLVPAPSTTAGTTKYLREDGTWQVPPDTNTTYTFTAGTSALAWNTEVTLATVGGLAIKAKLPANPNTNTWNALKGATSSADGTAGYAPAPPKDGYNTKYLRADGTWTVPPNTTYGAASTTANGLVTTGGQSWAGQKAFTGGINLYKSNLRMTVNKGSADTTDYAVDILKALGDNAGYGINLCLCGSGNTIIGGGESGSSQLTDLKDNSGENLYLVADGAIYLKTNGNTWANAKTVTLDNTAHLSGLAKVTATTFVGALQGNVTGNCSGSSGSCTGNAATATKATQDGSGNTITSTYVNLSGAQTITACKTFKLNNQYIRPQYTDITKGTNPSATHWSYQEYLDSAGTRLGWIGHSYTNVGDTSLRMEIVKQDATTAASMGIGYNSSKVVYTWAPHPPAANSSAQIATTAWVMDAANRRQCLVGQSGSTNTNPWYKFASFAATVANDDPQITFYVEQTYSSRVCGILRCHVRLNGSIIYDSCSFDFLANTGLDPAKFMLVTGTAAKPTIELWVKIDTAYLFYRFVVISEGKRTSNSNVWTLYNAASAGQAANPTSGTQITPTIRSVSNKAVTLAWNTNSTIATVNGTDITVKLPANPNTNTTYSAGTGLSLSGTTFSVASTAGTSALAWNSEVTLGTVGGLAIKAKLPANPNTNTTYSAGAGLALSSTTFSAQYLPSTGTPNRANGFAYTTGGITIGTAAGQLFKGSSNNAALISAPENGTYYSSTAGNVQNLRLSWSSDGKYFTDIFASPNNTYLWHRDVTNGTAHPWRRLVEENASGITAPSWNISIAGNAATATKLATARSLWGNSFDGSADISGGITMSSSFIGQKNQSITKGTNPSSTLYWTWTSCDKAGTSYGTNCLGMLETSITTAGVVSTYIRALKNEAASTANCQISCIYDTANNIGYTSAPTPAVADNSTKIATTAWVRNATGNTKLNAATVSGTAGTSTLAWNSEVTLYTVGGHAIKAKLPANPNTDTHWTSHLYAGGSGATANAATSNGGTYLSICDNSSSRNSIKITGSGATTVTSDANGVITINSTNVDLTYLTARASNDRPSDNSLYYKIASVVLNRPFDQKNILLRVCSCRGSIIDAEWLVRVHSPTPISTSTVNSGHLGSQLTYHRKIGGWSVSDFICLCTVSGSTMTVELYLKIHTTTTIVDFKPILISYRYLNQTSGFPLSSDGNNWILYNQTYETASTKLPTFTCRTYTVPKYTGIHYCVCETGAGAVAKIVNDPDLTSLVADETLIYVRFLHGNSVSSPTLNVSNTGAILIKKGTSAISASDIQMDYRYCFFYTGGVWQIVG